MAATAPSVIERGPSRAATFGPSSVIAMNVRASGRFTIPACSGDSPRPDCSSSVSTNMKLPKKNSEAKFSSSPAENARSRKSARFSSGSPPFRVSRRSQARVAASTGSASASETQVQTGQPSSRPSVSGTSASASPPETPTAPERVEPRPAQPARRRHHDGGDDQRDDADRHVDQEDGPPAEAEDVGLDQPAAEDLPGHEAEPHGGAVEAERLAPLPGREGRGDQRDHLRDHHRAGQPLHQPEGDEHARRAGPPRTPARRARTSPRRSGTAACSRTGRPACPR